VVVWVYDNEDTETIAPSGYTLDAVDTEIPAPKRVNVYAGGFQASFNILVMSSTKILQSLTISGSSYQVQDLGLPFAKKDLVITGNFSEGAPQNLTSYAVIMGYERLRRGAQTISAKVNGKTVSIEGVVSRIGAEATAIINVPFRSGGGDNHQLADYKGTYVKGEAINPATANFKVLVSPGGGYGTVTLTYGDGGFTDEDLAPLIAAYNPNQIGKQTFSLTIDGKELPGISVFVIDTEPAVWFDYGYMRGTAAEPASARASSTHSPTKPS
jgi:hypothetical protein